MGDLYNIQFPSFLLPFHALTTLTFLAMLFSLLFGALALGNAVSATPKPQATKLGAVASEMAVCSKIGIAILKDGGNAADAVSFPWPMERSR